MSNSRLGAQTDAPTDAQTDPQTSAEPKEGAHGTPIGFAHRGARAHAPENTLEAFTLALEMGAGALESDVWLTADGAAVLDHDGDVGGVPIPTLEREALPTHIPSLEDLYRECGADYQLSLDVKHDAAAAEVLRVATAADATRRLWLCHWSWKRLLPWREASPSVRLVDSTSVIHMRTPGPERAARMARLGIDALNLHHRDWSPELREALHREGRLAFAWDLQEADDLRAALEFGVDAVYSDHVDRMQRALEAQVASAG
jgi:glycerophosphoryl diester phosphodiesterase